MHVATLLVSEIPRGAAERLVELLTEETPTLIGIDHGFSFPLRYFETHGLKLDCAAFLDDFQRHWPTDEDHAYVDFDASGHCQRVVRTTTTTDDVKLNQPLAQQSCETFETWFLDASCTQLKVKKVARTKKHLTLN